MTEQVFSHLDLDALADALAGEGEDGGHLERCVSCASRLAELAAADARVSAVLAALPAPPVPAGLAERLSAALVAEAPLVTPHTGSESSGAGPGGARPSGARPSGARPSGDGSRVTGSSVTALPARRARRNWLPAAAAAVLVVSGAGLGYSLLDGAVSGGNDSLTAAGDSAAESAAESLVLNASGTDYADPAAVDGALRRVLDGTAGDVTFAQEAGPDAAARTEDSDAGETTSESQNDDSGATEPAPATALAADGLARLRTTDGLADCLTALLPPDEPDVRPLALDYARYQGQPALAVLLPDPDPAKIALYVVGAGCTQVNDSLLQFLRVDSP